MAKKYQIFFISHNKLAEGVLAAVQMIAGEQANVAAYGLMPGQNPEDKVDEIKARLDEDSHTLILADLFGGSMANAAVRLAAKPNVRLITGLNLALALQAVLEKPWTDDEINKLIGRARENVREVTIEPVTGNAEEDFF
ncbi:MAG: PTS sugar transporter subunit IIA [Lacticaseibacillus rhamnosus]